ncbi:MAG: M48 family metallopeptidase [Eubacterium sp.]|nr:M48 family metallopeptidase [Eubacterium sp.]
MMKSKRTEIRIIRSGRKTLALQITPEAQIVVRAPYRMPEAEIYDFVRRKDGWISKHLSDMEHKLREREELPGLSAEEISRLADQALNVIPARVAHFAPIVGVSYGRITIRNQKTRWGSCSARGNLNFNCLLMLTPPEIIDYVVVHELCHRKEMNHSARFWAEVSRVLPDYEARRRWLKENGGALIERMKKN